MRRVVTGIAEGNRSAVLNDALAETADVESMGLELMWRHHQTPVVPNNGSVPAGLTFPPAGGVWVITWTIPPFSKGDDPDYVVTKSSARPGLHSSDTVDINLVLSGSVVLELHDEEVELNTGDLVIVNGNEHSWHNRSAQPLKVISTIVGAKRLSGELSGANTSR
jgi:hypothetical protein